MVGYGPRLVFGWFVDRTERYWLTSITGSAANLLAVTALALAGSRPLAAALVVAERAGRAMRTPPVIKPYVSLPTIEAIPVFVHCA